jgi:hypothetical protein
MTVVKVGNGHSSAMVHVYPDPQNETQLALDMLASQVSFSIYRHADLVVVLGDLTNQNTAVEWARFSVQMSRLTAAGVPWLVVSGNHDMSAADRSTLGNDYLTLGGWVGGVKDLGRYDNSYSLVSLAGVEWLFLCLEWSPRTATVAWANGVLDAHPATPAVLVTHCYLYGDGNRYDWATYGEEQYWSPHSSLLMTTPDQGISDGQELWNSLVSVHSTVRLVLSGHYAGSPSFVGAVTGRRFDLRLGTVCHQMVHDYQSYYNGHGVLLEYRFDSANEYIGVRTVDTVDMVPLTSSARTFDLHLGAT